MILVTKTSDQTRQRGHTLNLYKSYLSSEHLVLPPLLPCCSPGYPRWQLLNQPFLFYIFFAFHPCLPRFPHGVVVVVVVDSHIQRIVLATEETTVTQQVSHRPINANPACGHKEVRRSTGHIMVTTRYSDQQGSKSRQKVMRLYKQWHRPI